MKIIKENLYEFNRGNDPLSTLGIGRTSILKSVFENPEHVAKDLIKCIEEHFPEFDQYRNLDNWEYNIPYKLWLTLTNITSDDIYNIYIKNHKYRSFYSGSICGVYGGDDVLIQRNSN